MVEIDRALFDYAQNVLNEFDPKRVRRSKLGNLEAKMEKTQQ